MLHNRLSKKQECIIEKLSEIAKKSDMRSRHAAAIVKAGKIRAYGHNSHRCSIAGNITSSTHAEIMAIYNWLKIGDCSTVDLWVIRIGRDEEDSCLRDSSPCISCVIALKKYNVKNVYYSDFDGNITRVNVSNMNLSETHVTRYQMNHGTHVTSWNLGKKWKMG